VKSDASKAADYEQLVKETIRKYGKLNISINNAGIGGVSDQSISKGHRFQS
jgi:NAD(P)-dependent dehydrogenase (short-subunit alcohol dehydrogenase family)